MASHTIRTLTVLCYYFLVKKKWWVVVLALILIIGAWWWSRKSETKENSKVEENQFRDGTGQVVEKPTTVIGIAKSWDAKTGTVSLVLADGQTKSCQVKFPKAVMIVALAQKKWPGTDDWRNRFAPLVNSLLLGE